MKKKKFNRKLYLEGLRQLRTIGVLGLVILSAIACLIPIGTYIDQHDIYQSYVNAGVADFFTPGTVEVVKRHLYFYLAAVIFASLMVIRLFRFLNEREDCDFYHAIPHTRTCIFHSFSAAAITWIFLLIAVPAVISAVCYYCARNFVIIDIGKIFLFAGNMFVVSLLIASALLLAISLCGNLISAIIVFLMLLGVPRIFLTIYSALLMERLDYLTDVLHLFQWKNNLLFAIPIALSDYYGSTEYVNSLCCGFHSATLYTLIIGIILLFLAKCAFAKRKSETAGSSMDSRFLQVTFRTIFVMLICLIPISLIYLRECSSITNDSEYNFFIVVAYLCAVFGLFVYELVTMRSVKSACKALKSLPLIVLLNIACFLFLFGSEKYYGSYRLDADKITSVNILSENNSYYDNGYFGEKLEAYEFTDKQFIEKLCDNFNTYVKNYTEMQDSLYHSNSYAYVYEYDAVLNQATLSCNGVTNYYTYEVRFHTAHSTVTFRFPVTEEDALELENTIDADTGINKLFTELPELSDSDTLSLESDILLDDDLQWLYDSLKQELADGSVDASQWRKALESPYDAIATLNLRHYTKTGSYYYFAFPISNVTPKTYQAFYQKYASKTANNEAVKLLTAQIDWILETNSEEDTYSSLTLEGRTTNPVSDEYLTLAFTTYDISETDRLFLASLKELIKPVSEYADSDCLLSFYGYSDSNSVEDASGMVCVPNEEFYNLYEKYENVY